MRKSHRWAFVMGLLCWLRNAFYKFALTRCAGANTTVRWRSATLCGNRPQPDRRASGAEWQTAMRYLRLAMLVLAYALISSPAFAQTCCPTGCAPEANRCVNTGPLWTRCVPIACAEDSRRPSARPYARAPKKRGARPPAAHSAYLRGRRSDPPALSQSGPSHRWKNGDRDLH